MSEKPKTNKASHHHREKDPLPPTDVEIAEVDEQQLETSLEEIARNAYATISRMRDVLKCSRGAEFGMEMVLKNNDRRDVKFLRFTMGQYLDAVHEVLGMPEDFARGCLLGIIFPKELELLMSCDSDHGNLDSNIQAVISVMIDRFELVPKSSL